MYESIQEEFLRAKSKIERGDEPEAAGIKTEKDPKIFYWCSGSKKFHRKIFGTQNLFSSKQRSGVLINNGRRVP